jgi:isochorismate synthase
MTGSRVGALDTRADPLGDAFDLLAAYRPPDGVFFERRGRGVAGMGGIPPSTFASIEPLDLPHTIEMLRGAIRRRSDVAPVAVGSLPFTRWGHPRPGLMIPERAVRRGGSGGTWRIDVSSGHGVSGDAPAFDRVIGRAPSEPFEPMQLREVPSAEVYREAVREATTRIGRGEIRKVVLARTVEVEGGRAFDPRLLAHRLRAVDPDAYTFAMPTEQGVLVGASPELLVSRRGREVRSNPLAGSAPRSGDADEDRANAEALVASSKDQEEHAIVVDAVAKALRPLCEELTWDPEPILRETPNVWHLSTRFRGWLRQPVPSALELLAVLHPTPAVAGSPREAALDAIAELESFDRGRYAGPVGWVDADGDGEWAIALRCAELRGDRAVLYAGAGIVAGSEPEKELDETERKFRAFLDALRWG